MLSPKEYPRRILVAVTGLSSQIVTETLYGLAVASPCPFVPTEIHLITTRGGAEKARLGLLFAESGWFHRLWRLIAGMAGDLDETERALRNGMDGRYFSTHLSKLRKLIKRELGPAAAPCLVSDGGTRPRRYRLNLLPVALHYLPFDAAPH